MTRAGAAFTLGVAFLLALAIPNAGSTTQAHPGSIRVADNLYVQAPGNEDLKHNIPDLEVVIGDQVLRADFLEHFRATGEIERWGYPTSEVLLMEGRTLTQFYQRGVVDFHNVGAGWVVERRLAWDYVGGGKGGSQDQGVEEDVLNPHEGAVVGPWGHKVSNFAIDGTEIGFADFFQRLGGVAAFGFPKTDARTDGKPPGTLRIPGASPGFIRQYFQAGVLEFHPGDTIAPVKLTLLGDTLRDILVKGWRTEPAFGAAAELVGGAAYDPYLVLPGDASRRLPAWFKEPPDNNHAAAASIFTQLYLSSPEIGAEVTGFPWVVDAISRDELVVLGKLHEVLGVDRETAGLMAAQLGNLESITPTRRLWIGEFADGLALVNPPAARTVAGAYWFQDGPNHLEAQVVATLAKVSTLDPNAAQTMANWPAVLNGISGRDLEGFQILDRIATFDTLSVTTIADLPWMSDGFDLYELHGLDSFYQIVRQNRGLARQILGQQWFTGGIDYWSQEVLNGLHGLQYESRELAHGIAGQAHPSRGLQEALYGLIDDLRTSEARPFLRITARDWFTDGLDDLDFAYATGLGFAAYRSQDLYAEFARARYHQTASFARPDGDRFEVFVFQNVPFEASENLADDAATAVRFAESFLQTPLPFNVLILLSLAPGTDVAVDLQLNDSFGRPVLLRRTGSAESNRRAIFRAVANQFIGHGPLWLREGQSQMMASQINAEAGIEDLDERAEELEQLVRRHCDSARRVSQVTELPRRGGQVPPCDSHLSELFMIELLDVMGPEGMGSALQRMIQVFLAERYDPFSSKDLHDQFFARTPVASRAAFGQTYQSRFGHGWLTPVYILRDDHGDNPEEATLIGIGSTTRASLQRGQDADVFKILVQAGGEYSVRITRMVPPLLRLTITDGSGREVFRQSTSRRPHRDPPANWVAPGTGEYYITIISPAGQTGQYELALARVESELDDHADEADFATKVKVGIPVEGTLGHPTDVDFFRFAVEAGRAYKISIKNSEDSWSRMDLIGPDGTTKVYSRCQSVEGPRGASWHWEVGESGDYFVAYFNAVGEMVDYQFSVADARGCGQ